MAELVIFPVIAANDAEVLVADFSILLFFRRFLIIFLAPNSVKVYIKFIIFFIFQVGVTVAIHVGADVVAVARMIAGTTVSSVY